LEEATFGVDTFRLNFPETTVHLPYSEWPMRFAGEAPDWVYSNPPCAPWSRAGGSMQGGRDHWRSDPRVEHTLHSFDMLKRYRPRVWSWESVETTYSLGEDLIDDLTDQALALGYSVTYLLTDGQLHGLPQRRRRFFMVVHSVAIPWSQPTGPIVTVEEALRDVQPGWHGQMSDDWRAVVSVLKPGQYLRAKWEELNEVSTGYGIRVAGRPPYTIHRIRGNQVCSTITSMRSQLHWAENRYLGNAEVAALLGYPADYRWAGPENTWQNQMAKAVTPPVAEYLARNVRRGLELGVPTSNRVTVMDWRPLAKGLAHVNRALLK
jgi:site-specific DNA-cytosine methylase